MKNIVRRDIENLICHGMCSGAKECITRTEGVLCEDAQWWWSQLCEYFYNRKPKGRGK